MPPTTTDLSSPPPPPPPPPPSSFTRSLLSIRRSDHHHHHHVHYNASLDLDLDAFQRHVSDQFSLLSDPLLSLNWTRALLDMFLSCHLEFDTILGSDKVRVFIKNSPLDRLLNDYFDRSVKALDVCNAVRDGLEQIREWNKTLDVALFALKCSNSDFNCNSNKLVSEGQFRRAKKAVLDLSISMMIDDKESAASGVAHRNRSFGRHNNGRDGQSHHRPVGHFRSLSWGVSRSWSAAKQLQAIGNNLVAPRGNDVIATGGVAVAVYTMSCVLLFVMWALVVAIPCQDRGLHVHFSIPRQFPWAVSLLGLHDRVLEESKKRERRNACGLLREIYEMEKCARGIVELADSVQFPLTEEKEMEVKERVDELRRVYEGLNEGLDPLERQVRQVFHRIVRSRTEGLDSIGRSSTNE